MLMIHLRLNPYIVLADIVRMFYSITYAELPKGNMRGLQNNRDLFRFLWADQHNNEPEIYRFVKVLMGGNRAHFRPRRSFYIIWTKYWKLRHIN